MQLHTPYYDTRRNYFFKELSDRKTVDPVQVVEQLNSLSWFGHDNCKCSKLVYGGDGVNLPVPTNSRIVGWMRQKTGYKHLEVGTAHI